MAGEDVERISNIWITDRRFMDELDRLKALRNFVIQEGIALDTSQADILAFGDLNMLTVPSIFLRFRGRAATRSEWDQLERHTEKVYRLMDEKKRRKFNLGTVPWWIAWTPAIGAISAAALLVMAILAVSISLQLPADEAQNIRASVAAIALLCYSAWLMMLGAVGSAAFIGMNVLSVQEDVTFDLTNRRLMVMRIVLGSLFALILTLPFGFPGFVEFCKEIAKIGSAGNEATPDTSVLSKQAMLLLLPFILGFSTSLVIMILNQLLEAVQAFFGRKSPDRPSSPAAEAAGFAPPASGQPASAPFKM